MLIKELFAKDIDRNVDGVITVAENDKEKLYQELDEYVVTDELNKHFKTFFSAYAKAANVPTTKVGVWISGFFGSGKSHFLKMLSYLLANKPVKGKNAIDFFVKDKKITNAAIVQDIKTAENIAGEVILFNIDIKTSDNSQVLPVFVNVFNEARGYSPEIPYLAELEEYLDKNGKFDEFKAAFYAIKGEKWEDDRSDFLFIDSDIAETLVKIGIFDASVAQDKVNALESNYNMTIEKFAQKVNDYCLSKGANYHLVFLADEMGQYIGRNGKMMLQLQSIVEKLGDTCQGKSWVIVTSQQSIDDLTGMAGQDADDFSKIQGRFATMMSLSSSNVDEVLKRRILAKTPAANKELTKIYDKNETIIKNLFFFTADTPFQKLYSDSTDFCETYPFVPYQFELLKDSLTYIRRNSASGRSISSGARSMISVFKETAASNNENGRGNEEIGAIVPYDAFYNPMIDFIDAVHKEVIYKAGKNDHLDAFDVRVLKALFLVKYVRDFKATLDNITTLLVDSLTEDRNDLKKTVARSLDKLERETLVQKNLDIYEFLTDQEQDVNRSIKNERVDDHEVSLNIAEVIFSGILHTPSFKYSQRYNFKFNQLIDDKPMGNRLSAIGVNVLTPISSSSYSAEGLYLKSSQDSNNMLVVLPIADQIIDDVRTVLKIEKYTNRNSGSENPLQAGMITQKRALAVTMRKNATEKIKEAAGTADIYIQGSKQTLKVGDPNLRLTEGLRTLVNAVYTKLSLMEGFSPDENTIKDVLKVDSAAQLFVNESERKAARAIDDVAAYLNRQRSNSSIITLAELKTYYSNIPYGFVDEDIYYLLAVLYKDNKISLKLNSEVITAVNTSDKDIYKYFTQSAYKDKLVIECRTATRPEYIRAAKEIHQECFARPVVANDEDSIMKQIKDSMGYQLDFIKSHIAPHYDFTNKYSKYYRGKAAVAAYETCLSTAHKIADPGLFFKYLADNQDNILAAKEEFTPVSTFFDENAPVQYELFNKACDTYKIFEDNKEYLEGTAPAQTAQEIGAILQLQEPYNQIKDLDSLINAFRDQYYEVLNGKAEPFKEELRKMQEDVKCYIQNAHLQDASLALKYETKFQDILNEIDQTHDMKVLYAIGAKGRELKEICIKDIDSQLEREKAKPSPAEPKGKPGASATIARPVCKQVRINELIDNSVVVIKNKEDIDNFVESIGKKLEAKLKDGQKTINLLR